ncbi:MAG: tRNA lysidine(34) synthetase TilS [Actinomycetota bacterium]
MRRPPAVARVLERVIGTAREHEMFPPGETVLVSVSGGPDSVCLLYSLLHLRRLLRIRPVVFHFDHRLRPDSGTDAEYVRRLAARLRVPFHLRTADDGPPRGSSVELWARLARRAAADEVAERADARSVALGHTLDDQAETVLMALVLGWGPDGLSGMRPVGGGRVRPLLDVRRDEVEAFCRALHLRPRRDPTNRDTRLLRNAIRLKGRPALERVTGRELAATIARTAELLRVDQDALAAEAARAADRLVEPTDEGCRLRAGELASLSPAVAGRVARFALRSLGALWTQPDVEGVLDLAGGRPGRRRDLANGLKGRRDREYVLLSRTSPESRV